MKEKCKAKGSTSPTAGNPANTSTNPKASEGKFTRPTPSEKNRHGKWWKYDTTKKRWFKDKTRNTPAPQANVAQANIAQPSDASTAASTITNLVVPGTVDTRRAVREAALNNAAHSVNLAEWLMPFAIPVDGSDT
jgi:hypothetical protein